MALLTERLGKDETNATERKVKATGTLAAETRQDHHARHSFPKLAEIGASRPGAERVGEKVWGYIKSTLQDVKDRRRINGDEKLQSIFGK